MEHEKINLSNLLKIMVYKNGNSMRIPGVLDYTGAKYPFRNKKKKKLVNKHQSGGKNEDLLYSESGSKIHIKKKNRGKFTDYCGGNVTQSCIDRAKKSGNKTLKKRAIFAENARHFKH